MRWGGHIRRFWTILSSQCPTLRHFQVRCASVALFDFLEDSLHQNFVQCILAWKKFIYQHEYDLISLAAILMMLYSSMGYLIMLNSSTGYLIMLDSSTGYLIMLDSSTDVSLSI